MTCRRGVRTGAGVGSDVDAMWMEVHVYVEVFHKSEIINQKFALRIVRYDNPTHM